MMHGRPRPRKTKKQSGPDVKSLFMQPKREFYAMPEMEVRAGRVLTDGCKQIIEYKPQKLCLDFGRTVTTFYGNNLQIEFLAGKRLVVAGTIARIEFSAKGGGNDGTT